MAIVSFELFTFHFCKEPSTLRIPAEVAWKSVQVGNRHKLFEISELLFEILSQLYCAWRKVCSLQ